MVSKPTDVNWYWMRLVDGKIVAIGDHGHQFEAGNGEEWLREEDAARYERYVAALEERCARMEAALREIRDEEAGKLRRDQSQFATSLPSLIQREINDRRRERIARIDAALAAHSPDTASGGEGK